jgi:signal peptidase II
MASGEPSPTIPARPAQARRTIATSLLIAGVVVCVDQLTKAWALRALDDGTVIDLVWTLRFRLTFNSGMAFGKGSGWGPVIALLATAVSIALLVSVRRQTSKAVLVAVGLIVGGAVGNLIDRVFRADDGALTGRVVDFVDLQWWPVFNVADAGIVVGGIALVVANWLAGRRALTAPSARAEPSEPSEPSETQP